MYVDVGVNGSNSDRGVWSKCALKSALEQTTVNIPTPTVLPGRNIPVPYVTFQPHDEALPSIKSNGQKPIFQLKVAKDETHIRKRGWNTGKYMACILKVIHAKTREM